MCICFTKPFGLTWNSVCVYRLATAVARRACEQRHQQQQQGACPPRHREHGAVLNVLCRLQPDARVSLPARSAIANGIKSKVLQRWKAWIDISTSTSMHLTARVCRIHTTLVRLKEDGLSKDAADRITTCLSQHRLGTRTWRPPTQVMA